MRHRYVSGHNRRGTFKAVQYVIEDTGYKTECWSWALFRNRYGYGQKSIKRKGHRDRNMGAHRWYYEQRYGPIPKGLQIDHLCRNRACVNPDHLEIVTPAVNQQRRIDTPLTAKDVRNIRRALANKMAAQNELATQYGVSPSLISRIRTRARWASIA